MLPLKAVSLSHAMSLQEPQLRLNTLSVAVNTKGSIFRKTVLDEHRQLENHIVSNKGRVHSGIHAPLSHFLPISDCFRWLTISILGWSPYPIAIPANSDFKKPSVKMSHLLLCLFCLSHLLYWIHVGYSVRLWVLTDQKHRNANWDTVGRTPLLNNACIVTVFLCNYYEQLGLSSTQPRRHWLNSALGFLLAMTLSWLSVSQVVLLSVLTLNLQTSFSHGSTD